MTLENLKKYIDVYPQKVLKCLKLLVERVTSCSSNMRKLKEYIK